VSERVATPIRRLVRNQLEEELLQLLRHLLNAVARPRPVNDVVAPAVEAEVLPLVPSSQRSTKR
jgi:hypothetical protein